MPINIDQEIAKVDNEILALTGKKPALAEAVASWRNQSLVPCNQISASKRTECENDKRWKLANSRTAQTQLNDIDAQISAKKVYRQSLLDQKASENRQAETLASQGLSSGALMVQAEAQSEAIKTIADAQAKTVTDSSESSNQRKNIIIIVVIVVVLTVGILLYKKLKTKK
jgi:cobalamin biosynthesis Mg chelatase CobN